MKIFFVVIILMSLLNPIKAQYFGIFDINTTEYPVMQAKYIYIDENGRQLYDTKATDFTVLENKLPAKLLNITNAETLLPKPLSVVLSIDISGSMKGSNMEIASASAKMFVNTLAFDVSECALTTFNGNSYLNCDFTQNPDLLLQKINEIEPDGGTNYNEAFITARTGALNVAKKGKNKKVVIFLTDGWGEGNEQAIIDAANNSNTTVYCITLGFKAPDILRNIALKTGGICFDNVQSKKELIDIYVLISSRLQKISFGTLHWQSSEPCNEKIESSVIFKGLEHNLMYYITAEQSAKVDLNPQIIRIKNTILNKTIDTFFTIAPKAKDLTINAIELKPDNFFKLGAINFPIQLKKGQLLKIPISFIQTDSVLNLASINVYSNLCEPAKAYISSGYKINKTLNITTPNGAETYGIQSGVKVNWTGIDSTERVLISYSPDNGESWVPIDLVSGSQYNWITPQIPSDKYKLKISQTISNNFVSTIPYKINNVVFYNKTGTLFGTYSAENIIIWNTITNKPVFDVNCDGVMPERIMFTNDPDLVTVQWPDSVVAFNIISKQKKYTIGLYGRRNFLMRKNPATQFSVNIKGKEIVILNLLTNNEIYKTKIKADESKYALSDNGRFLAITSDNVIEVFTIPDGKKIHTFEEHGFGIDSLVFLPNSELILSVDNKQTAMAWSPVTQKRFAKNRSFGFYYSADSTIFALEGVNGTQLIDPITGKRVGFVSASELVYSDISIDKKFLRVVTATESNIYSIADGTAIQNIGKRNLVNSINFSSDYSKLMTTHPDHTIRIWDTQNGSLVKTIVFPKVVVDAIFSPSESKILLITADNYSRELLVVNYSDNAVLLTYPKFEGYCNLLTCNAKEDLVLVKRKDNTLDYSIQITDNLKPGDVKGLFGSALLPDRSHYITTDGIIYDFESYIYKAKIPVHGNYFSFSSDGKKAVCWSGGLQWEKADKLIEIINMETYTLEKKYRLNYQHAYFDTDFEKMVLVNKNMAGIVRLQSGIQEQLINIKAEDVIFSNGEIKFISYSANGAKVLNIVDGINLQEDESDNYFSVKSSKPKVTDIDFGKLIVGNTFDKSLPRHILNPGPYPAIISDIFIRGDSLGQFAIVSGFAPYTLQPKNSNDLEIRFAPLNEGTINAELVIVLSSDTVKCRLTGKSINNPLKFTSENFFLGKIKLKQIIDTNFVVFKNVSTETIQISSIINDGPDKIQFAVKAPASITLPPGGTKELGFVFKATQRGLSSTVISYKIAGITQKQQFTITAIGDAPDKVTLNGIVQEQNSGKRIQGTTVLCTDLFYNRIIKRVVTGANGEFKMVLDADRNYAITAERNGYLSGSENINLTNVETDNQPKCMIYLSKFEIGSTIRLNNIFFNYDDANLNDLSKNELERIYKLMLDNPSLIVEISGHTDNTGNEERNKVLSVNRAEVVKSYLTNKGISAERMKTTGFGSMQPIVPNDNVESRKQNRRVEFKIIRI